jgi:hypothetical protein
MCSATKLEGGAITLLFVAGPEGVVGKLQVGTMFVVDGIDGVFGALIVVGLGS